MGKSAHLKVTDLKSETGNFAFTTLTCIPGVMSIEVRRSILTFRA